MVELQPAHLTIPRHAARKYSRGNQDLCDELESVCNVALVEAVNNFDVDQSYLGKDSLRPYLWGKCKQAIKHYFRDSLRVKRGGRVKFMPLVEGQSFTEAPPCRLELIETVTELLPHLTSDQLALAVEWMKQQQSPVSIPPKPVTREAAVMNAFCIGEWITTDVIAHRSGVAATMQRGPLLSLCIRRILVRRSRPDPKSKVEYRLVDKEGVNADR